MVARDKERGEWGVPNTEIQFRLSKVSKRWRADNTALDSETCLKRVDFMLIVPSTRKRKGRDCETAREMQRQ